MTQGFVSRVSFSSNLLPWLGALVWSHLLILLLHPWVVKESIQCFCGLLLTQE